MIRVEEVNWDTPYILEIEDADEREATKNKMIDDYLEECDPEGTVFDRCMGFATDSDVDSRITKSDLKGAVAMSIMTDKLLLELRSQVDMTQCRSDTREFTDGLLNALRIVDQDNIFRMVRNGTEVLNILSTILGFSMDKDKLTDADAEIFIKKVFPATNEDHQLLTHISNTMIRHQELIDKRQSEECGLEDFEIGNYKIYLIYMSV